MSHFPDDVKEDKVTKFTEHQCVDCDRSRLLVGRTKVTYWLGYAFEDGHDGDADYVWLRHKHDWRCRQCAAEWFEPRVPGTLDKA